MGNYSEQQRWGHFYANLDGCNKGGSSLGSFFRQLYALDDYGGERGFNYLIQCSVQNVPEINDADVSKSSFYLHVVSPNHGDRFRISTSGEILNIGSLVLPRKDLRLVWATQVAFSDWAFSSHDFIPEPVFRNVTLPLREILITLGQGDKLSPIDRK